MLPSNPHLVSNDYKWQACIHYGVIWKVVLDASAFIYL